MRALGMAFVLSTLSICAAAQEAAAPPPVTEPYIGVEGLEACSADSNAAKIDRGESLGNAEIDGETFEIVWPDCERCVSHALMILDPSVVEAPVEQWSLRHLLAEIAGAGGPGDAVETLLGSMRTDQIIHSFDVSMRPDVEKAIVSPWVQAAGVTSFGRLIDRLNGGDGEEDANAAWEAAPFRLISIGYRPDLLGGDFEEERVTSGGEGRFIFQAVDAEGGFVPMLVIFEYELPATHSDEAIRWAEDFHALTEMEFGDAFNEALVEVTTRFTDRDVSYARPNNNMLSQLRTNELAGPPSSSNQWELREFRITHAGRLEPAAVQMNPDLSYNIEPALRDRLVAYILGDEFIGSFPRTTIPWSLDGEPFLGGSSITPVTFIGPTEGPNGARGAQVNTWLADLVVGEGAGTASETTESSGAMGTEAGGDDANGQALSGLTEDIRHRFASTTCNGCHGGDAIRNVAMSGQEGEEGALENQAIATRLVPHGYFLTGFTHVDGRGERFGHVGEAIMSEFMCESDLVARAAVMQALLASGSPEALLVAEGAAGAMEEAPSMEQSALEMSLFKGDEFLAAAEEMEVAATDMAAETPVEVARMITLGTSIIYQNMSRPH